MFLDIKEAFPSMKLDRLIHNMHKRGIPKQYTDWIRSKVTNRSTQMVFDDYISPQETLYCGIDQGCPLSGILFLFYNADLLEITCSANGEDSVAVVDDATILVKGVDLKETTNKLAEIMNRQNGLLTWSRLHGCEFALNKFALIGFTRRRSPDKTRKGKTRPIQCPSIEIDGHIIEPSTTHKFLGVHIDQELRFREQTVEALHKGTKWIEQYKRLAKSVRGVSAKHMLKFYYTVALLKMLYAADVFLVPESNVTKGTAGFTRKLARIHRQALIATTGALNTTATDFMEMHAHVPTFKALLKDKLHREAMRLACLPETHPLYKSVCKVARRYVKRHRAPIHEILHAFNLNPLKMEKISPVSRGPKWAPRHKMHIQSDESKAIEKLDNLLDEVQIFTDRSRIDGGVGAAAMLYKEGKEIKSLHKHLGPEEHHMVFEAELVGILMGTHLALKEKLVCGITICVDNQAAISTTTIVKQMAGQYLVKATQDILAHAAKQHADCDITLRWIPGHKGMQQEQNHLPLPDQVPKICYTEEENGRKAKKRRTPHQITTLEPARIHNAIQIHWGNW